MKNEFSSFNCITSFESGHEISLNKKWFQLTYLQKTTLFSHEYKWQKKINFSRRTSEVTTKNKSAILLVFYTWQRSKPSSTEFWWKSKKKIAIFLVCFIAFVSKQINEDLFYFIFHHWFHSYVFDLII